jgi:iron-sulfur cluster insertion protein
MSEKGVPDFGLRVQVVGGGCEGFFYDLLFEASPRAEDQVFESEGVRVFVDSRALPALDGTRIDIGSTPYGTGLMFQNPRARSHCACGASFST